MFVCNCSVKIINQNLFSSNHYPLRNKATRSAYIFDHHKQSFYENTCAVETGLS